jgi:Co/Zn/Cd efflux system component
MHEHGGARQGDRWHGDSNDHGHPHSHDHSGAAHGHAHGAFDPTILTTARGIRAIKWSFVGLLITALFQIFVVWLSGSVALLADTIHNFGDAATAVPLWVAFTLAPTAKQASHDSRRPGRRVGRGTSSRGFADTR